MDKEKYEILNSFYKKNKDKCLALNNWIKIQRKDFKLTDALECIYDYANGKSSTIIDIINHLHNANKVHGRTQVYADDPNKKPHIDIIRNGGKLELINYNPKEELNKKGQKVKRNPEIFRQKDGQTKKPVLDKEKLIIDVIGPGVRALFPNESAETWEDIMWAVLRFKEEKKINVNKVLKSLEKHKLVYDPQQKVLKPSATESKVIIIKESVLDDIRESEEFKMTKYKFNEGIKQFLSQLLTDPINTQPSLLFTSNGLERNKLIQLLLKNNLLIKTEKLSDKDENGNPKKVTMKVRFGIPEYKVPKEDFKHNLNKLFIKLFEKNVPQIVISEDGEGGAMGDGASAFSGSTNAESSGEYDTSFGVQRKFIKETDSMSVGNYEYDVPFLGDKETLARKNGKCGSVSIPKR